MAKEKKTYTRYLRDQVLEPYFVQLDDYGYVVHRTIVAEDSGKEYSQVVGYYQKLSSALGSIAKHSVMSKNHDSIQGFINEYESTINKLNQAYNV